MSKTNKSSNVTHGSKIINLSDSQMAILNRRLTESQNSGTMSLDTFLKLTGQAGKKSKIKKN